MPGLAVTNEFILSTATVMLGAPADLKTLNPTEHSVGLVKNFSLRSDPRLVELGQGILNDIVATAKVDLGLRGSWEMYEYTAKNLAYAAGLNASTGYTPFSVTHAAVNAESADQLTIDVATDLSATYTAGSWVFVQSGTDDLVHIGKVASAIFGTETVITLAAGYAIPFPVTVGTTKIGKINKLDVGLDNTDNPLAMKVVAILPNQSKPLVLMFPKVKVTKGLDFTFSTDAWNNMPFEVTPYRPVAADAFYDADFPVPVSVLRQ